jgi:hypothetical protein
MRRAHRDGKSLASSAAGRDDVKRRPGFRGRAMTAGTDTVHFRFTAGDTLVFDVLSTEAELEECRNFLRGVSVATTGRVRMGLFGPFEVLLTRGTDDWSVGVCVCAVTDREGGGEEQRISANLRRADLLKAFTPSTSLQPRSIAEPASSPALSPTRKTAPEPAGSRWVLHSAADAGRLAIHVATHWTAPHIVVAIDRFAELDRQRAQSRITHLAEVGEYQSLGAVAAIATIVLGTIRVTWQFTERTMEERFVDTYVTNLRLWEYAVGLAVAAACAWLVGRWIGALACRLRLLLALCRLWYRARSLERAA